MMTKCFISKLLFAGLLLTWVSGSFGWAESTETKTAAVPPAVSAPKADAPAKKKIDIPTIDSFTKAQSQIETVADTLEYSKAENKVIGRGNVVIKYGGTSLTADYAEVATDSKKAYAKGHVVVFQGKTATTKTEEIFYDFETETGSMPEARFASPPWFSRGKDIQQIKSGVKQVCNGGFSSCNMEDPYYEIRAKKITIYEEEKIVAQDVTLYIHDVPVFWLPYMIVPIDWMNIPISVAAGYNHQHGYYIETTKRLKLTPEVGGKLYFDWRSRRGIGSGLDLDYNYGPYAQGLVKVYGTKDERAPSPNAVNPFSETRDRDRGRFTFMHRTDFDENTNLIMRFNRIADEYFLQEFFEREFRAEVQPQSFATFTRNTENAGFYLTGQPKVNAYESLVERLPEARYDWRNQPLVKIPFLGTALHYEAQTSFSNLVKNHGRTPLQEEVVRFDAVQQISLPMNWKELKFTPYTLIRGTNYSRQAFDQNGRFRTAGGWGADLRTQLYRQYPIQFDKAGIEVNQLRHIIEPSIVYTGNASTLSDERLTEFDQKDRIDDSNLVTFGLENRFQTKRVVRGKLQRVDLVSLNTFLSFEHDPDGRTIEGDFGPYEDGNLTKSSFSILTQEVVLRPYNWLQYELRADADARRSMLRGLSQDVNVKVKRLTLVFGHRVREDYNGVNGGNQFVFDGTYKINRLWDVGGYIRWNGKETTPEEWQVVATRHLACDLILNMGYNVRNSQIATNDNTLFFEFYLQTLPGLALRSGAHKSSFAPALIGDTVAGANEGYGAMAYAFENNTADVLPLGAQPQPTT